MASDKLNNKNLNQNFKVKGIWWIPSKENKQEMCNKSLKTDAYCAPLHSHGLAQALGKQRIFDLEETRTAVLPTAE